MTDLEKIEDWVKENKFVDSWSLEAVYIKDLLGFIQSLKPKKESKLNFSGIHAKLEQRLLELTGKKQYRVQGKYSFLPSDKDLQSLLTKFSNKYKVKDKKAITNCLILHIQKAVAANFEYVPLLGYYISKNGQSQLAADLENRDDVADFIANSNNEISL